MKGTVFQPRMLQLNLDKIHRLPHSEYPDRKNRGICRCGTRTHDLLHARQAPKLLRHRPSRIYCGETDVLMDKVGRSRRTCKILIKQFLGLMYTIYYIGLSKCCVWWHLSESAFILVI